MPTTSSDCAFGCFLLEIPNSIISLYRSRTNFVLPAMACKATGAGYQLSLPQGWLDEHPLTAAALEAEMDEWRGVGLRLEIKEWSEEKLRAAG